MKKHDMQQQLIKLGNGAHALAIQMLGNSDDAADAVHDAFAKVLAKPGAFDSGKGQLKPWFLRVVRNRCIDMMRRRRAEDDRVDALVDPGMSPQLSLEIEERDRDLQFALARLSVGQRQIIVLRDYMDLSYAEIADVLEIAAGTVMSRLHRARLALRQELLRHD